MSDIKFFSDKKYTIRVYLRDNSIFSVIGVNGENAQYTFESYIKKIQAWFRFGYLTLSSPKKLIVIPSRNVLLLESEEENETE